MYKGNHKFINIDVDPVQLGRNIMSDLGICADGKLTLEALLEEIRRRHIRVKPTDLKIPQIRIELERKTDYDD